MGEIIRAENVKKAYGNRTQSSIVIDNLNLSVEEGTYLAIIGRSGSGKSTILNMLSGMDHPTEGKVLFDGKDISLMKEKELSQFRQSGVGIVLQGIHLIPFLTAADNIRIAVGEKKRRKIDIDERLDRFFEIFGMSDDDKNKYPSMMSGGENQRIAIMRALINKPKVLFFDEPTGALNRSATNDILKYMDMIHRSGQTIVMVTHDAASAERADRVLYIEDGKICNDVQLSDKDVAERHDIILNLMEGSMRR